MSGGLRSLGRREETADPLAFNPRETSPDRSIGVSSVRNPGQSGGTGNQANTEALLSALGGLSNTATALVDQAKDTAITEGKIGFMQGKTLDDIRRAGNDYTVQGYETLSAVDQANKWYTNESVNIQKEYYDKSPDQYAAILKEQRNAAMKNLPADPAVRKAYVAAFEDAGPRLAAAHIKAYSEHVEKKTTDAFTSVLASTSTSAAGATQRATSGPLTSLRVSDQVIDKPVQSTARDRDIGIRTMLGEAGGEGEVGLAAVAHVLKNRAGDKRWGGSIADVALAPKQFTAWSPGAGGVPKIRTMSQDDPAYLKAAAVYDAVVSGRTVDPTNGATHYYAPKGMPALVAAGAAKSNVPSWAGAEGAKNEVRIGGHVFSGKAGGGGTQVASLVGSPLPGSATSFVPLEAPTAFPGPGKPASGMNPDAKPVTAETERQTQLLEGSVLPTSAEDKAYLKRAGGGSAGGVRNGTTVEVEPGANPQDVAQAQGVPTNQPKNSSQVRELILGYNGLKPEKKAAAVADAMRRQLAAGDDSMFNDAGGVGILRELGASPQDIDETLKAKQAYDKQALGHYNSGFEKERAQFLADAKSGKFTDDELIGRNTEFRRRNLMNDSSAQGLIRDALSASAAPKT